MPTPLAKVTVAVAPRVPSAPLVVAKKPLVELVVSVRRRGAGAVRGVAVGVLELVARGDVGGGRGRRPSAGVGGDDDLGRRPGGVGLGEVDRVGAVAVAVTV